LIDVNNNILLLFYQNIVNPKQQKDFVWKAESLVVGISSFWQNNLSIGIVILLLYYILHILSYTITILYIAHTYICLNLRPLKTSAPPPLDTKEETIKIILTVHQQLCCYF